MGYLFPADASQEGPALTGEVIYESLHHVVDKKAMKAEVRYFMRRCLDEIAERLIWASYLVIFSPGQDFGEVRCQVDVETDAGVSGFAIGFGRAPGLAFRDAMERVRWREKDMPARISG